MKKFDTYMVNKIFTVPYLDRMISEDSIPDSFFECVRRYVKTDDATIGEAISEMYHFMNYEYRNEYYYKNTILNQLLIKKHDLYNTAALTELPIGNSKADFIMINDRGVVYEIKTDLDNLIRLENQLKDYYKVFSYIYVVVGNKQLPHVKEFLKEIVNNLGLEVTFETKKVEDRVVIKMYSNNNNILIGHNGNTIKALENLVRQKIQLETGMFFIISLDVENYKDKKISRLERLAKQTAREVKRTHIDVHLENMNSYERRIIHNALSEFKGISTKSTGEEPNRHIVISYIGEK